LTTPSTASLYLASVSSWPFGTCSVIGFVPLAWSGEAPGEGVRRALAVGARQDQVVARLLTGSPRGCGERHHGDEPDDEDDEPVPDAQASEHVQGTSHERFLRYVRWRPWDSEQP